MVVETQVPVADRPQAVAVVQVPVVDQAAVQIPEVVQALIQVLVQAPQLRLRQN